MFSTYPHSRSVSYFIFLSHHSGLRERRGLSPALQLDSRRFLALDLIFQLPRRPSICMCVNIRKREVEGRPLTKRLLTQSSTLADVRSHLSFVREEGRKEGRKFCGWEAGQIRVSHWRSRVPLLRARTFSCQRLTLSTENEGHLPGFGSGLFGVEDGATPPGKLHRPGPRASRLVTSGALTRSS